VRRTDLERAAGRLAKALGQKDCLLIGGLAVAAHGFVRGTEDVDFVVRKPLRQVQGDLRDQGIESRILPGDLTEGDFPCLKGTVAGVPFDVLPALVPLDWENSVEIPLGRQGRVRVVDLNGLLHLKLRAGGPRDLMDVATLVQLHPGHRAKAHELAVAYRLADKLDAWLNDARIRPDARARYGRRRRKPAGRSS
jgi:hypothetical protein